ncbi:MAG: hypothetical protein K2Q03_06915 [Sphingobacteriaceae bacterium]|nr:hypothetical protein [Sphingobacteriaceae bacterium]
MIRKLLTTYYYVFLEVYTKINKDSEPWWKCFCIVGLTIDLFLFCIGIIVDVYFKTSVMKNHSKFSIFVFIVLTGYLLYHYLIVKCPNNKIFDEEVKKELGITKNTKYIAFAIPILLLAFIILMGLIKSDFRILLHN